MLKGEIGEVRMTIQVKRKETGKVEEYELVGKVTKDDSNPLDSSERRGDERGS